MQSFDLIKSEVDDNALTEADRRALVVQIIKENAALMDLLSGLRALCLPDWRLVSGAIYQTIWNRLTGNDPDYGIKDYDIAYFDDSDLSYEAEDAVIKRVDEALPLWADKLEVRNQARVHLWYEAHFGHAYPKLSSTDESLDNYLCTTHAIAVRLEADDSLSIAAPFGLADLFSMTIRPCRTIPANEVCYKEKAKRMARLWPQLKILHWETEEAVRVEEL